MSVNILKTRLKSSGRLANSSIMPSFMFRAVLWNRLNLFHKSPIKLSQSDFCPHMSFKKRKRNHRFRIQELERENRVISMKASQSHPEFESVGSCYSVRLKNGRMEEKPNTVMSRKTVELMYQIRRFG